MTRLAWGLGCGVVCVAAYLAFLGWGQQKELDPQTGTETGPYAAWQVMGVALVLAAVAAVAGWAGRGRLAVIVLTVVLTTVFAIDAATGADADGLWPIGAGLVALAALAGTGAVAALAANLARRRAPGR